MNATITNNSGGGTNFQDQSTAANATIINNNGGTTTFGVPIVGTDTATAGSANITNNAGGTTEFTAATTAANATITNKAGGFLQFGDSGSGARPPPPALRRSPITARPASTPTPPPATP